FEYLRVTAQGRLAFLAQGATDQREGQNLRVFFSAEGEVLKLSSGRIVEFSSRQRHVVVRPSPEFPPWNIAKEAVFAIETDMRPGYLFSSQRSLLLRPLPKPPGNLRLEGLSPLSLQWFEEIDQTPNAHQRRSIYAVLFVAEGAQVVYSEQCIAADLCLTLQRWRASGSY
ncbi:MAG: hypothetical protein EBR85_09450, partial [Betaproteobacteria bacterium]|nr:hypothetical protein [Betaproteobacteria bacterium]